MTLTARLLPGTSGRNADLANKIVTQRWREMCLLWLVIPLRFGTWFA